MVLLWGTSQKYGANIPGTPPGTPSPTRDGQREGCPINVWMTEQEGEEDRPNVAVGAVEVEITCCHYYHPQVEIILYV